MTTSLFGFGTWGKINKSDHTSNQNASTQQRKPSTNEKSAEWEKIFAHYRHLSDKWLIFKIYKELIQLKISLKNGQEIEYTFF